MIETRLEGSQTTDESIYTLQRPLGLLEKYQLTKSLLRSAGNVTMTAVLRCAENPWQEKNNDTNDPAAFYRAKFFPAVDRLVEKYPPLSIAVKDADKPSAHLIHQTTLPVDKLILFKEARVSDDKVLQDLIANECDSAFDVNIIQPLWRLLVTSHPQEPDQCTITIAVHHVIADGLSLSILLRELCLLINDPACATEPALAIHHPIPPHSLAAPMDERHPPNHSIWGLLSELSKELFGFLNFGTPVTTWQGDKAVDPKATHHTRTRLIRFGGNDWAALKRQAKEHGVSVHAGLYCAMVLAWSSTYGGKAALTTTTPVSARPFCTPAVPTDELGNFVGGFDHRWCPAEMVSGQNDPWALADKYYHVLQANKIECIKNAGLLRFLSNYPDDYLSFWTKKRKKSQMGRTGGMELSDLGLLSGIDNGEQWKVESLWFCQSANTYSVALGLSSVSLKDSSFTTLQWQQGTLDESKVDQFVDAYLRYLGILAHESSQTTA